MAVHGRPALRDLFDDSPTPHIAHPPETHHRDVYVATDGSYRESGGGLGAIIETRSGERLARVSLPDIAPNNNVAEYRALHLGLDVLAGHVPRNSRVGILLDHDDLAANVNATILSHRSPNGDVPHTVSLPANVENHWRGIRARLAGFDSVRAARIASEQNPAHPLANSPEHYAHLDTTDDRRNRRPDHPDGRTPIPPPSRADRHASD